MKSKQGIHYTVTLSEEQYDFIIGFLSDIYENGAALMFPALKDKYVLNGRGEVLVNELLDGERVSGVFDDFWKAGSNE